MFLLHLYRPYLDIAALALLGGLVLFPRPGVTVMHALPEASALELDRIAELEAQQMAHPGDTATALQLSDLYLSQSRPDWSLATIGPLIKSNPNQASLRLAASMAFAERLDFVAARVLLDQAEAACNQDPLCKSADRTRIEFLLHAVGDVVSAGASYAKDPNQLREILDRALHHVEVPFDTRGTQSSAGMQGLRACTMCHPKMVLGR